MGRAEPFFTFRAYLQYLLRAQGAHGLHSPFVYGLYTDVIRRARSFSIPKIEALRTKLRTDKRLLPVKDFRLNEGNLRTVGHIARKSLSTRKFSSFMHLLAEHMGSDRILETGTSLGINTAYLASSPKRHVCTIEWNHALAAEARAHLKERTNVEVLEFDVSEAFQEEVHRFKPNMVFLDADHRSSTVHRCMDALMAALPSLHVIVIHDIYWSRDMNLAWRKLVNDPLFPLTVDIFQAGIVFPNIKMEKQHFTLKF